MNKKPQNPNPNIVRTQLRVPREINEWLHQKAKDEFTSVNAVIVRILLAEKNK